jgi:hypothetical protein
VTIREGHNRRRRTAPAVADLLRPGGAGVLVTELVSTDTSSELDRFAAYQYGVAVRRLIENGPWRWRVGAQRSYLAYGLMFCKALRRSTWASGAGRRAHRVLEAGAVRPPRALSPAR